MDESRENIPPTECPSPHRDGAPRSMEANPLAEGFYFTSTPAYNRNVGVNSKSQTPCLLPELTPVSKYLRKVLTSVNTPTSDFVPIKDEILPHVSFDVSTMVDVTSSPVVSKGGAAAEAVGSCSDIENVTVHTLDGTLESSAKLCVQATASPINDTFDVHPPGPSKCNNVTADAEPTDGMAALHNTFDAELDSVTGAEADPAEVAISKVEPCGTTFEAESVSAPHSSNSLFESHTRDNPQNTFDMDSQSSASLPNQTTTSPMIINPQNTFDLDSSTNLASNHQTTTTSPMSVNPQNTFDFTGATCPVRVDPQNTFDLSGATCPVRVDPQNTFDLSGATCPVRVDPQNTFDLSGATCPMRVNPENTVDMDSPAKLTNQTTGPENDTFDVHPAGPSKCKNTTVDAELNAKMVDLHMTLNEPVVVAACEDETDVAAACEDEPVVVTVSEDELGLVVVSEDEQGLAAVSEDERGVAAVSEDERGVAAVSEDERGVAAVSEDERCVAAVSEDERGVAAVSEDERGVAAVSEDERGVVAVSEDERGVVEVSQAELGVVAVSGDALGVVAVPRAELGVVEVSGNELAVVAVSGDEPGVVAVSGDEPGAVAVSEAEPDLAVAGPSKSKDNSQSSTLKGDDMYDTDSPAFSGMYSTIGACSLEDSLREDFLQMHHPIHLSTPMSHHTHATENLGKDSVVPRKLYQAHSQFVPPTNTESDSQFVAPTNLVCDRKTFMNVNDPRVKHLLPPSVSMIPGGPSKKHSGLPMMRRAQADGPGSTAALPKEGTGIPKSIVPEAKGIPKAMVTRSAGAGVPAVGAALPGSGLRKRQGVGLPLATQRAMPGLRPPLTRSMAGLAGKAFGEPSAKAHTNAAPAIPLLKLGQPTNRRDLRRDISSGESALLAKRETDGPAPSTSAAGPSQTVSHSLSLKRPGSRLALPGAKQKKMDDPVVSKASAPSQPGRAARGLKPLTGHQRAPPPPPKVQDCPNCANCAVLERQLAEAREEIIRLKESLHS